MISPTLIIERPHHRPAWARGIDVILSAVIWLLYFYLIREVFHDLYLVTNETIYWMFDGRPRPSVPEISDFLRTVRIYTGVILANGWLLILWALYNQVRFRGRRQPAPASAVTVDDLAALYRLSAEDIARWQGSRIMVMEHDPEGALVRVSLKGADAVRSKRPGAPAVAIRETTRAET
jgi:biofilm PGA synthesis protein PgaD